jgi:Type IV secretion system pilin
MSVGDVVGRFTTYVINPALLILAAAGFLVFVWGLVQFMLALSQGGDSKEGKNHMLWGVVGMVIMFSVAGIIALINNTFNFGITPGGTYTPNTQSVQNINTGVTFFH